MTATVHDTVMTDDSQDARRAVLSPGTHDDRRRIASRAVLGALVAAAWPAASVAATASQVAPGSPVLGTPLPLLDVPLIEGGTFRAASADGQVVVVYWWASWCPFCAEMSPSIDKLWRTQRDRGLVVLGIAIDKTVEAPREYRRKRNYTFPSTVFTPEIGSALAKPRNVPVLWVRDRAGRVALIENGQMFPEDVEQLARFL